MIINRPVTEEFMVATFLKAEINSRRWGPAILNFLTNDGKNRSIIDQPDVTNADDNAYRAGVLGCHRGYKRNVRLFSDFPGDVKWYKATFVMNDLSEIRCVRSKSWLEHSKGTLLAKDVAARINSGQITSEFANEVRDLARIINSGQVLPEIIVVAQTSSSRHVAIEGNMRLTAYLLDASLRNIPVIVGYAQNLDKWEKHW